MRHRLYKRSGDEGFDLIFTQDSNDSLPEYLDENVSPDEFYEYVLEAIDDDSLTSERALPLRIRMIDFEQKPAVQQVFADLDTENKKVNLNWNYPYQGEFRYVLYKAINGSNFVSFEGLTGNQTTFEDNSISEGNTYEYTLQVIYEDGNKSPFGKIVKVEY